MALSDLEDAGRGSQAPGAGPFADLADRLRGELTPLLDIPVLCPSVGDGADSVDDRTAR
jgi:hypothetical protein